MLMFTLTYMDNWSI